MVNKESGVYYGQLFVSSIVMGKVFNYGVQVVADGITIEQKLCMTGTEAMTSAVGLSGHYGLPLFSKTGLKFN